MIIKTLIFNTDGTSYIEMQEVMDEVLAEDAEDDDDIPSMTRSEIEEIIPPTQADTADAEAPLTEV